jgi:4-hydroxy-4-methyl-2-oxoglutarate aldolase
VTDAIRGSLERLDTCALSDALDRLSVNGAVSGFLRWGPLRRVAGRVRTVALAPGPGSGSHLGTRTLAAAEPGDVIVVANEGRCDAGSWGGLLTLEAEIRGVAAVILDGALRDVDQIEQLGVPLFARSATPRSARRRFHERATDVAVTIDDVSIEPGCWALADGSGVVFVPACHLNNAITVAEEIAGEELRMEDALRGGARGRDVLGARYEKLLDPEP